RQVEIPGERLSWQVKRMRLTKDRQGVIYNDFLTLADIPLEAFEYKLGNRSALEWIVDQYQVSVDKRSGITNDPNRADDPQYIVRLIGQVVTVSVETMKIVDALPPLEASPDVVKTKSKRAVAAKPLVKAAAHREPGKRVRRR